MSVLARRATAVLEDDRAVSVDVTLRVETDMWSFVGYSQDKWRIRSDGIAASDVPQDTRVNIEVMGRERILLGRIFD